MVSARSDPGLAVAIDWSARKREVLAELNNNWPHHEGNQVYLDIVVGGRSEQTMRLVFALFMHEVPLAAANFHALCTQRYEGLGECGHPLTYRRSKLVRIVRGQFLQGGDMTHNTGGGGDSIYGGAGFEDEQFGLRLRHNTSGLLSMANHGADTNRSQFLITTGPAPSLDGKHVVFGRIVSGAFHLQALDALPVDSQDVPATSVMVTECGAIPGWHRPPLPMPDAVKRDMSLPALGEQAAEARSAVAGAVQEALQKRKARGADDEPAREAKSVAAKKPRSMLDFSIAGFDEDEDSGDDSDGGDDGGDGDDGGGGGGDGDGGSSAVRGKDGSSKSNE